LDRKFVYPGSIPEDSDILQPQVDTMISLGWLLAAAFGTNTGVAGLPCAPTVPASMVVNVGPGAIWAQETIDANAFGSLPADSSPLMKMGINAESAGTNFTLSAPTTSGNSVNYLIEASFQEADGTPLVLPYVNPANPASPYAGPNNTGVSQNTVRTQRVQLQLKAGAQAPTGTQVTPSVDSGWIGLYVITVNNGQTTINSGAISVYPGAPFVNAASGISSGRLLNVQTFSASGTYTPTVGTNKIIVELVGGGGGGAGAPATSSSTQGIGSGGGSGGYAKCEIALSSITTPVPVTVGIGGTGGIAGAGSAGAISSFGTYVVCAGGQAGIGATGSWPVVQTPGAGGNVTATAGTVITSSKGAPGQVAINVQANQLTPGYGGSSPLGMGGTGSFNAAGGNGGPGAGGGGVAIGVSLGAENGGNGGNGLCIVYEYS